MKQKNYHDLKVILPDPYDDKATVLGCFSQGIPSSFIVVQPKLIIIIVFDFLSP